MSVITPVRWKNVNHPDRNVRNQWGWYWLLRDQVDAGLVELAARSVETFGLDCLEFVDPELAVLYQDCFADLEACRAIDTRHGVGSSINLDHNITRALLRSRNEAGTPLLRQELVDAAKRYQVECLREAS